jgi:hypothetical protein
VPAKLFKSSLKFASKAGAVSSEEFSSAPLLGGLLVLPPNIRLE